MSVGAKVWKGTVFVSAANLFARLGTFSANLVIIRILGKNLVGELGFIESWLGLATMLSLFGIGIAATKYIAQYAQDDPQRAWRIAGAALSLGVLFSLAIATLSYFTLKTLAVSSFNATFKIINTRSLLFSLLILSVSLKEILVAIVYGQQMFQAILKTNIVIGLISFPTSLFLVSRHNLSGALESRLFLVIIEVTLLVYLINASALLHKARFSLLELRKDCRQLIQFGFAAFVGQLGANPVQTFLLSVLAAQVGGLAQVGMYTTANRLTALASFLPGSMASTLVPVLSSEWGKGDATNFREATLQALRMFWLVSLPVIVFFLAASPTLMSVLYGHDFNSAWPVACALLMVTLLSSLNETADRALAATGHIWLSSVNNYIGSGMTLLFALILIPRYSALGYAIALSIAFAFYLMLQLGQLRHLFSIRLQPLLSLTVLSSLMSAVALLLAVALQNNHILQILMAIALTLSSLWIEQKFFLKESEKLLVFKYRTVVAGFAVAPVRLVLSKLRG